jgi:integrase
MTRPRKLKRSDGRYVVKVTYEDEHGLKRRFSCYGKTQTEANAKARAARDRLAAGAPVRDDGRDLASWVREWTETFLKRSDRSVSTKRGYADFGRRWIVPHLGHIPLSKVRPSDVVRLMGILEDAGRSQSTQRNCYAALSACLSDAVANGLLWENPVPKVRRPRLTKTEARCLTEAEVKRLIKSADGWRYLVVVKVILATGLRRGEALGLRWEDLDLGASKATVRGSLVRQNGALMRSETKTKKSTRAVALSPPVVALLKTHMAGQARERLKAGNLWKDTGYVFTTEFGTPVDGANVLHKVTHFARLAELPDAKRVGVHTLRHTYATTALLRGVPIHVVSQNLGHSSIRLTADTYGHVPDEASHSANALVSAAFGF